MNQKGSMLLISFLILLIVGSSYSEAADENGCTINLDTRTGKFVPFFLEGITNQIIYPIKTRILESNHGDTVIVHCHGSKIKQSSSYPFVSGKGSAPFSCEDGKWMYDGDSVDIATIECESIMYPSVARSSIQCSPIGADGRKTELDSLVLVTLGFNFTLNYSPMIAICHDEKNYGTIWTKHTVRGESINLRDSTSYRPSFRTNIGRAKNFYPFTTKTKMTSHYSKSSQVRTILELLSKNSVTVEGKDVPIIDERTGSNYFAKGHLSPDASFVYVPEQDSTYFYFNVAPQFQSFNNRNWKSIEFKARNWAADNGIHLDVYTGTNGILEFKNTEEVDVEINLFPKNSYVPAPKYFWKVLHDPNANVAIAFVGLNNPHARTVPEGICTNVCEKTEFADEDFMNFEAGYVMCCELSELMEAIPSIPNLLTKGVWPSLLGKIEVTEPPIIKKGCQINVNRLQSKYPPIFAVDGKFLYSSYINEDDDRIKIVPEGSNAEMFCHRRRGNSLLNKGQRTSKVRSLILNCENEELLSEGKVVNPEDYRCKYMNQPLLNIVRDSKCSTEGADKRRNQLQRITSISLGWELEKGFTKQIEICVDELLYATLWTSHSLDGEHIAFQDMTVGRIAFRADETGQKRLFGGRSTSKINRAYSKKHQKEAVETITGHKEINGNPLIETSRSGTNYFARGHLSPDAGFIDFAEQMGTYFFVNVAPQFQSFNNGNWKSLEMSLRDLAEKKKSNLQITTGTYEILSYYDREIFILEGKFIPAPKVMWKVAYDPNSDRGVAFIGSNDIHSKTPPTLLCPDVCNQLSWVDWDRMDISKGYMYCCEVKALREAISYAPDLDVPLLTNVD